MMTMDERQNIFKKLQDIQVGLFEDEQKVCYSHYRYFTDDICFVRPSMMTAIKQARWPQPC